ncbi:hypothetical protein MAP00_003504 [Monascus purpureus]|nr:hypothetical protein MAP00_003504 [Monascus purpureus]
MFVWHGYRMGDNALLSRRLMKQRSLLAGMWFSFCNNSALSVVDYYLPTYLQVVEGVSTIKSGILCLPISVRLFLSIFLAGSATSLVGYYTPFMLVTGILMPIASGLLTTLKVRGSLAALIC